MILFHLTNITPSNSLLANSCQWEGRNMENNWKDQPSSGSYDPYAKDAKIKEAYKEMNEQGQSARLRMDAAEKIPSAGSYENSTKSLETLDQEKVRLSHQLNQTLIDREIEIQVFRRVLHQLESRQKNGYFLKDSINSSSRIQMDQIHQMREYLK